MNRDHWKQMLPYITHFAEGGEVEAQDGNGNWVKVIDPVFNLDPSTYRKKPTPSLVLRTSDDPELVWLKNKNGNVQFIYAIYSDGKLETQSWRTDIAQFHKEGCLCSATRNGPWLPLVKEEIV